MTPEQQRAQDNLQKAMSEHVEAFKSDPTDNGILVDWACVAQLTRFNEEGGRDSAYHLIFSGGEMEEHRAKGIWHHGIDLLTFGERE